MIEKVGGIARVNRISSANQESPYKKEDKDNKEKKRKSNFSKELKDKIKEELGIMGKECVYDEAAIEREVRNRISEEKEKVENNNELIV